MTLKKVVLFTVLLLGLTPALAHELARDGNVGALMHTDPDDAPLVGKPTAVFFELNQRGGKAIPLAQCRCTLQVYAGSAAPGRKPQSTGVLKQTKNELTSSVTFPVAGAYTMVLQGAPRPGFTFPAFRLSWTVRAGGSGGMDMDMNH
ncbi:hypothetical protein [Deinococcus sonorensis]|uniref:YtkA-like domain-containing protein n=2 Tax=Deinococcus sonorensis TaxID=309891 RepID=A0AAU7UG71_9DEIO